MLLNTSKSAIKLNTHSKLISKAINVDVTNQNVSDLPCVRLLLP